MDIGSISSAISSLKAAKDIAQAMFDLKSLSDVQAKVIELQEQILSAQGSALDAQTVQFELKKKLAELEHELARLRAWETEKNRYSLAEVSSSVFVRELKTEHRGSEPAHWLCCNCFDKGEKSILQLLFDSGPSKIYECQRCGSKIQLKNPNWSPPSPSRGGGGSQSWMAA